MRSLLLGAAAVIALFVGRREGANEGAARMDRAIVQIGQLQKEVADLRGEVADMGDELAADDGAEDPAGRLEGPAVRRPM